MVFVTKTSFDDMQSSVITVTEPVLCQLRCIQLFSSIRTSEVMCFTEGKISIQAESLD